MRRVGVAAFRRFIAAAQFRHGSISIIFAIHEGWFNSNSVAHRMASKYNYYNDPPF